MPIKSIKATDRILDDWQERIKRGLIKLPRFQRHEAWDRKKIEGLLTNIVNNLPLGITLILEVGDEAKFADRYIKTAEPKIEARISEHLLDGQQRLTAFWRTMHNNYQNEKDDDEEHNETYYIYFPELNQQKKNDEIDRPVGYSERRWINKDGRLMPTWADSPKDCYKRGLIPTHLFRPGDIKDDYNEWIDAALVNKKPSENDFDFPVKIGDYNTERDALKDVIIETRETFTHFNLPYLALPVTTPKDVALDVFIKMNTNSEPLKIFDIVVAQVEGEGGESLHEMIEDLEKNLPEVSRYSELSDIVLAVSALLQDKTPSNRGVIEMDRKMVIHNWNDLERGLKCLVDFLQSQKIFDKERLPTNAVLAVIAALYSYIPDSGDQRGRAEVLLRKYLWSSFFTDRYENSAASNAYYDFVALKSLLTNITLNINNISDSDVPVLNRVKNPISTPEELANLGWPKKRNIRSRAVLAVSSFLGAFDFADGLPLSSDNISKRHYHHIFPDALLKEAGQNSSLALNCAFITDRTNYDIGRKDPLEYLKDRYQWVNEETVNKRLNSHLVPVKELMTGSYYMNTGRERLEKIVNDFQEFIRVRAELMYVAAVKLCEGEIVNFDEIIKDRPKYVRLAMDHTRIEPGMPFNNLLSFIRFYENCHDYIYVIDPYFKEKSLEYLSYGLSGNKSVRKVKIVTWPGYIDDRFVALFKKFRRQYIHSGIDIELRVVLSKSVQGKMHDRFVLTKGGTYNIPSADTVGKGSMSSISNVSDESDLFDYFWRESVELLGNQELVIVEHRAISEKKEILDKSARRTINNSSGKSKEIFDDTYLTNWSKSKLFGEAKIFLDLCNSFPRFIKGEEDGIHVIAHDKPSSRLELLISKEAEYFSDQLTVKIDPGQKDSEYCKVSCDYRRQALAKSLVRKHFPESVIRVNEFKSDFGWIAKVPIKNLNRLALEKFIKEMSTL